MTRFACVAALLIGFGCGLASAQHAGHAAHPHHAAGKWGDFHGEKLEIVTTDGVKLTGYLETPFGTTMTLIMVPMLANTMESYYQFTEKLHKYGVGTFVFDLRGHGESRQTTSGAVLDWKQFADSDYARLPSDVVKVYEVIRERIPAGTDLHVMGSGIGANAVMLAAEQLPDEAALFLMSPGLEIHGLNVEGVTSRLRQKKIYILTGSRNSYYNDSAMKIASLVRTSGNHVVPYTTKRKLLSAMHGSAVLNNTVDDDVIRNWLFQVPK